MNTLDESHPMNRLAITHLRDPKRLRFHPSPIAAPSKHADPYEGAGSHTDIVERLWDRLGRPLPIDGRALVYGTPAPAHTAVGVIPGGAWLDEELAWLASAYEGLEAAG